MQDTQRTESRLPNLATRFQKGQSGNPTGEPARHRHTRALNDQFLHVHGRSPNPIEAATIKNIAAMMVRSGARRGVSSEDLVRLSNSIDRLVSRLGLVPKSAPEKKPKATLKDYVASRMAGE
jgi:hypothetical protein